MDPLIHLPEHDAIVCSKCKHAVLATTTAIHTHLSNGEKHIMPVEERQRIAKEVMSIPGLRKEKEQFNPAVFPSPDDPPIPELGAPRTDGLQCQFENDQGEQCRFIACQVTKIKEHCRLVHQWGNPRKKGRPEGGVEVQVPWRSGVHCQHFFVRGTGAEFFEVAKVEGPKEARQDSVYNGFEFNQQEIKELIQKAEEVEREIKEPDEAREPNAWLNRVGWAVHYANFDPKDIRKLVARPSEEEEELQILAKAFKWLIQGAQFHAVRNVVGIHALFATNKKEADKEPSMPFNSWMDITTVHSYVDVWERILFYIYRVEDLPEDERPKYELQEIQQIKFDEMQTEIQEFQIWRDEQADDSGVDVYESDDEIKWIEQIQKRVLDFCIALLDHPIGDNEYESAIISGLAALGIREEDNKWYDAEDYTPKYSAVIKLARLMVVEKAYRQRLESIKFHQSRGMDYAAAKKKTVSMFQSINRMIDKYMTMAHSGRNPTPMHWIFHSRTYGFKIRYTTTAKGVIQWIGDDVLYPGIRFNMSKVRRMVHGVIHEARELLFNELMMVGVNASGDIGKKCPPIDWDNMVDQPSESRVGWSFLEDERNKFAADKQWWLFKRVFEERRLKEKFMDREGRWKETAFQAYSRNIERFQELLLLMMHFAGMYTHRIKSKVNYQRRATSQSTRIVRDKMEEYGQWWNPEHIHRGGIGIVCGHIP